MQRYSVGKTLAVSMFAWGGTLRHHLSSSVSRAHSAVASNFGSHRVLYSCRKKLDRPYGHARLAGYLFPCILVPCTRTDFTFYTILGFTESIVSPAFLLITGLSYRKEEHAMRVLIWGMR